jgi:beta-xylosidase
MKIEDPVRMVRVQRLRAIVVFAGMMVWGLVVIGGATPQTIFAEPSLNWGDQGDGTYRNPILPADYSDPDAIRVGNDFYLVASDFHFVGMQVLHSRDLVNWEVVGQVFDRLTMSPKYDEMTGYAQGTWAPTLRYHNGTYFVFVCTPFEGLFMWHAKNPAGPWSKTVTVKAVERWEDPCPFWDDDGKAYLIHSLKGAGPLILNRMSPDGTRLLDAGVEIYHGPTAEGPKLFKQNSWYYVSLPEGGVGTGGQTVLRSKNIYGPYERRVVLPDGSPHQGALVELPDGDWWFLCFKSSGFLGRITYLMPVTWGTDDWPVFGDHGHSVDQWKKPDVGGVYPIQHPQRSDDFNAPGLSPIWQWNQNPVNDAWSLTARPGWLRLQARPATGPSKARNSLTEKLWGQSGVIDTKLDVGAMAEGQCCGFAFMSGDAFDWVGVTQSNGVRQISWDGGEGPVLNGKVVWLRGSYHGKDARLLYSTDGGHFTDTGLAVELKFGKWKGARLALFCYGSNAGVADVDFVKYNVGK